MTNQIPSVEDAIKAIEEKGKIPLAKSPADYNFFKRQHLYVDIKYGFADWKKALSETLIDLHMDFQVINGPVVRHSLESLIESVIELTRAEQKRLILEEGQGLRKEERVEPVGEKVTDMVVASQHSFARKGYNQALTDYQDRIKSI